MYLFSSLKKPKVGVICPCVYKGKEGEERVQGDFLFSVPLLCIARIVGALVYVSENKQLRKCCVLLQAQHLLGFLLCLCAAKKRCEMEGLVGREIWGNKCC